MKISWVSPLCRLIGVVCAGLLLTAFLVWIDPWVDRTATWTEVALNAAPTWAVFLVLVGALGRPSPALLASFAWISALFYLNSLKLDELGQPLLFTDLWLLGQVLKHLGFLSGYVNVPWVSSVLVLGVIGFWVLIKSEPRWLRGPARAVSMMLGAVALWGVLGDKGEALYRDSILPNNAWSPAATIESRGWMASAVAAIHTDWVALPEASRGTISMLKKAWMANQTPDMAARANTIQRPDVVVILSESFFEPRYLKNAKTCVLLPRWCELIGEGAAGEMTVPTFGGNTTRTEYELLTGVPYAALPQGIYPYTSVVLQPTASIVWWAKHLGYETTAVHPHDRYFWQRHRAFPLLGFDEFLAEDAFGGHRREGFWISDDDLTDKVMDVLDRDSDAPQWVFAISMENHGPWHASRPNIDQDTLASLPTIDGLEGTAEHAYRTYLYHQRNAVSALDRLWQHVQTRDRPTVVLFFGDHLPGLHETFEQAGFTEDWTPMTHPVPYLALAHPNPIEVDWQPTSSHQLGVWLMDGAGLPLPTDYGLVRDQWRGVDSNDPSSLDAIYPHLINLSPKPWLAERCERFELC